MMENLTSSLYRNSVHLSIHSKSLSMREPYLFIFQITDAFVRILIVHVLFIDVTRKITMICLTV